MVKLNLCPHHAAGGNRTGAWLQLFPAAAKFIDSDLGASVEALPGTTTVGRVNDYGHLLGQGFDPNRYKDEGASPDAIAALYVAFLLPYIKANKKIMVWEGPNEPVLRSDDRAEAVSAKAKAWYDNDRMTTMLWYAEFCYAFAQRIHDLGLRAGIGSWASGIPRPEHNVWRYWGKALQASKDYGAVQCYHDYMSDAALTRVQYNASEWAKLGYLNLPHYITELGVNEHGGGWRALFPNWDACFDTVVKPWMDAAYGLPYPVYGFWFTDGGSSQWWGFDVSGTNIVQRLSSYIPPKGDVSMDEIARQQAIAALLDAQTKNTGAATDIQTAIGLLQAAAPAPQPWWATTKVPFVALANSLPLITYVAPNGAIKDKRPNATYDLNVSQVSGDWLLVAPNLWVKAADVHLKA